MELKEGDVGKINDILSLLTKHTQIDATAHVIRQIGVNEDDFATYERFIDCKYTGLNSEK